jgi:hypothetical protein
MMKYQCEFVHMIKQEKEQEKEQCSNPNVSIMPNIPTDPAHSGEICFCPEHKFIVAKRRQEIFDDGRLCWETHHLVTLFGKTYDQEIVVNNKELQKGWKILLSWLGNDLTQKFPDWKCFVRIENVWHIYTSFKLRFSGTLVGLTPIIEIYKYNPELEVKQKTEEEIHELMLGFLEEEKKKYI